MHTVILQSYRSNDIPAWLQRCMQTVKQWAAANGYHYAFVDDALFDYVPPRFREPTPSSLLPFTDLARLGLLREKLASGYSHAIWIDADVVIFRPDHFRIPDQAGAMLCHEIWTQKDEHGVVHHAENINNAVMVFERGHPLLDFLHHAAIELFTHLKSGKIRTTTIGTDFLTKLGRIYPIRLLTQVACLSPALARAISTGAPSSLLQEHAARFGHPFHAANLCRSKHERGTQRSTASPEDSLDASQLLDVVEKIIAAKGEMLSPMQVGSRPPAAGPKVPLHT